MRRNLRRLAAGLVIAVPLLIILYICLLAVFASGVVLRDPVFAYALPESREIGFS